MTFVVSTRLIAVGICAGLASALLVLSPVGGSLLAVPLTILVDLPLVIAALGWGTSSAIAGVLAGTGTLLAVSPSLALYLVVFLAPVAVIGSHLVGLSRQSDEAATPDFTLQTTEWYPLGRVLMIVAFLVVAGAIVVCVLNGFDPSAISADKMTVLAHDYAEAMAQVDTTVSTDDLTKMLAPAIETTLRLLPFAFTLTWTVVGAFNLGLGIWITTRSGNLLRPREDLAAFDLPRLVAPVFVVALVVGFTGGVIGAMASALAGAMAGLLLLAGLSVLHTLTRPLSFRLPLLVLVYLFLGLCALPLIVVGILEPYTHLRRRVPPRGPAKPSNP
jgi:hypothetical protein